MISSRPPVSRTSTESELAVELYASAAVVVSHHFQALGRGESPSLSTLERVAQAISASGASSAFPLVIALASMARDDAARAVQGSMLTISAARRVTRDPRVLRRMAMAALLVDVGRARLAGLANVDLSVFSALPDALDALAPASSAAVGILSATSRSLEPAAITAFEVAWLERPRLGAPYAGTLAPRLAARLIATARAFLERLAPRGGDVSVSPFEALRALVADPKSYDVAVRLLADAVGLLPIGTVVELSNDQWAVVSPPAAAQLDRVVVRVLTDATGRALERPSTLDLGNPPAGKPAPRIVRVVDPAEARFNLARAFYAGA